jgi:hypothetical protein
MLSKAPRSTLELTVKASNRVVFRRTRAIPSEAPGDIHRHASMFAPPRVGRYVFTAQVVTHSRVVARVTRSFSAIAALGGQGTTLKNGSGLEITLDFESFSRDIGTFLGGPVRTASAGSTILSAGWNFLNTGGKAVAVRRFGVIIGGRLYHPVIGGMYRATLAPGEGDGIAWAVQVPLRSRQAKLIYPVGVTTDPSRLAWFVRR